MFCKFHILGTFLCWISAAAEKQHPQTCIFQRGDSPHSSCVDLVAVKFSEICKLTGPACFTQRLWEKKTVGHARGSSCTVRTQEEEEEVTRRFDSWCLFLAELYLKCCHLLAGASCSCTVTLFFRSGSSVFPSWFSVTSVPILILAPHLSLFLFPVMVTVLKTSCPLDLLLS